MDVLEEVAVERRSLAYTMVNVFISYHGTASSIGTAPTKWHQLPLFVTSVTDVFATDSATSLIVRRTRQSTVRVNRPSNICRSIVCV